MVDCLKGKVEVPAGEQDEALLEDSLFGTARPTDISTFRPSVQVPASTCPLSSAFTSTIQYGYPKNSLIVDNRNTSLFRDNYKMYGTRYKYELEDMICDRITQDKFVRFKERLSGHFLYERNSPHEFNQKLINYKRANKSLINPNKIASPVVGAKQFNKVFVKELSQFYEEASCDQDHMTLRSGATGK